MKQKSIRLFGILGYPLSHTLSPVMQEVALEDVGLKGFYLTFETEPKNYASFWRSLSKSPLQGLNVTVPFKENVFRSVKQKSPEAKAIGAVNTLYKKGSHWAGTNTDAYGFSRSLKIDAKFSVKGKRALIFGGGGSTRAVLYALLKQELREVVICNRTLSKAHSLRRQFNKLFPKAKIGVEGYKPSLVKPLIQTADIVVNTTSLGLKKTDRVLIQAKDVPRASGSKRKVFFDLIYKPAETKFLKVAKVKGHKIVNGLGMLAYQGAKSFEIWTGKKAPEKLMKRTLEDALL